MTGLRRAPILGSGLSNFGYVFSRFKPESFSQGVLWQLRLDRAGRAGSYIAELTPTTGVLGIAAYLSLAGIFLALCWAGFRRSENKALVAEKAEEKKEENVITNGSGGLPVKIVAKPQGAQGRNLMFYQLIFLVGFVTLLVSQFVYYQNTILAFSSWLMLGLGAATLPKQEEDFAKVKKRSRIKPVIREKVLSFKNLPELGLVFSIVFWLLVVGTAFLYFNMAKYYLADVLYRNYWLNPAENTNELARAAKLGDGQTMYHVDLARAYLLSFLQELNKEQPDSAKIEEMVRLAVEEAKKAEELSPNKVTVKETAGLIYWNIRQVAKGALDWAIKSFEDAVRLEPNNPLLSVELGRLYLAEGEGADEAVKQNLQEEARKLFEKAIILWPDYVEAHFQLGRIYYNTAEYDKAEGEFLLALSFFPDHSNSLYSLALIYERRGDKDKAIQFFERVLDLNPGHEEVMERLDALRSGRVEIQEPEPLPLYIFPQVLEEGATSTEEETAQTEKEVGE